jgi:uncharacterized protein (TIGR00290 family)
MNSFITSWSGGKDSCFAMMQAMQQGLVPKALLNMMNENGKISRSHGIPLAILERQAAMLDLALLTKSTSWNDYEATFINSLNRLKHLYKIDTVVFGDIDLKAHRDWEENVCTASGLKAFLPLWQQDRKQLVSTMIESGIEAYIVSCNEAMGEKYLGKKITSQLINELEDIGVDVCGENGEYHSLVINAPIFKAPINVAFGNALYHGTYYFIEMKLQEKTQQADQLINNHLKENEDYYWENGFMVFTAKYHLKRGHCCKSGCRHCPYGFKNKP